MIPNLNMRSKDSDRAKTYVVEHTGHKGSSKKIKIKKLSKCDLFILSLNFLVSLSANLIRCIDLDIIHDARNPTLTNNVRASL